jgi:hypothetical protein
VSGVAADELHSPSLGTRPAFATLAPGLLCVWVACAGPAWAASLPDSASTGVVTAPAASASATSPTPAPRLGGYLQVRHVAQEDIGLTTFLNRARFSIDGTLPTRFSYRALVEMQASAGARVPATVSLREAIVRWSPEPFALTAGEFKTPFTREYLIPVPALELADLATVVDSLAPRYDVGLMGEFALAPLAALAIGVFNGEGANAVANRDSTVMLVGRATVRPIPQLALGASGARDGEDSLRWGVDAVVQHEGAQVRAEYVTRHVSGRARFRDDFGWYVFEAFRVVPRVQLVARQEDFQRPAYGASRRVRSEAYGSNFEIAPGKVRLLLEFLRRTSGAKLTSTDAFIAQLQAQF